MEPFGARQEGSLEDRKTQSKESRKNRKAEARRVTLQILPAVSFTFVAYLCVGIPLAILPGFVHLKLGVSTLLAGLLVSLQYVATFASRPRAGRMSDTVGPRQTVRWGLAACCLSGLLIFVSSLVAQNVVLSLLFLALSRLALGVAESMTSTGSTMWAIGRVGTQHTAKTISLNGVATYGALALGAPIGVALENHFGLMGVGAAMSMAALASWFFATRMAGTATVPGDQMPAGQILLRVVPYGMGLALGGAGFGVIATFITLYFAQLQWSGAALSLTIFGVSFVGARLFFASWITRVGGFKVSMISFVIEVAGLLILAFAPSPQIAYLGTALSGLGFSLVFPALAVEVVKEFPLAVHGSVLGLYSAFVDGSLFLTGPLAGAVIDQFGYRVVYALAGALVASALALTFALFKRVSLRANVV